MMSFGEKEFEAVALIEPENTNRKSNGTKNGTRRVHKSLKGSVLNNLLRFSGNLIDAYRRHRKVKATEKCFYAMSDRELRDIGVVRSEINFTLMKTTKLRKPRILKFLKSVLEKVIKARKAKVTYVHLMSAESKQLAEIEFTRRDINASLLGTKYKYANANLVRVRNGSDRRRAS